MGSPLEITKEKVAETVKEIAILMDCDQRTAYEKYCHDIVKMAATWEEIKPLLSEEFRRNLKCLD